MEKEKLQEELIDRGIAKEVHAWYHVESDRIVFEPIGYSDKRFSLTVEDTEFLRENNWYIRNFYDGFVEIIHIEPKENEKLEQIKEIVNEGEN